MILDIILDLGGVIVDLDINQFESAFQRLGVSDVRARYQNVLASEWFCQFETGDVSAEDFRFLLKKEFGLSQMTSDVDLDNAWCSMLAGIAYDKLVIIERLLTKGHRLFLYSNNNVIHVEAIKHRFSREWQALESMFTRCYFSNELGHRKPNADSFRHLLAKEGLQPSRTLFIDDKQSYVEGAKEAGIHSFHLNLEKGMNLREDALMWIKLKEQQIKNEVMNFKTLQNTSLVTEY